MSELSIDYTPKGHRTLSVECDDDVYVEIYKQGSSDYEILLRDFALETSYRITAPALYGAAEHVLAYFKREMR